jgi:DNA polymerase III subunit beta
MDFTLDREQFAEAMNWVARVVPAKPLQPALSGVKIEADMVRLMVRLSAYDLEVSAEVDLLEPPVIETSGSALVSGRLLSAIARALPRKPVQIQHNGSSVELKCGDSKFTLPTLIIEEYPTLPQLPGDVGVIEAKELSDGINRVLPAAARDDTLPFLSAVNVVVVDENTLRLYATDKHRMATTDVNWTANAAQWSGPVQAGAKLLIPAKAVADVARIDSGDIHLGFDAVGALLGVHTANRRTTTRLLEANYPDCEKVIPAEDDSKVTVHFSVEELTAALNRAALLDNREYPRVTFELVHDTDTLTITGGDDGFGAFEESVGVKLVGGDARPKVNPRYVLDALNAMPCDEAVLHVPDEKKPLLFKPYGSDINYRHVIMPTV